MLVEPWRVLLPAQAVDSAFEGGLMVASRETLQDIAAERQLQPATLERVIRLIDILGAFGADTLIGPRRGLEGRHGAQRLPFRS